MSATDSGLGPLGDGGRVVVVGGGPAGVATAIALKQGARALGRDIQVVVVEGKQFAGHQQYLVKNGGQCHAGPTTVHTQLAQTAAEARTAASVK